MYISKPIRYIIYYYISRMSQTEICNAMIRSREILNTVHISIQDGSYRNIIKLIDSYLKTNCIHEYVDDMIDIDPDTSKNIRYCIHCEHSP
tara:strand:+ start:275 stop:547 length:273 start_codon:yes stop_codon:yes gene_type:complete